MGLREALDLHLPGDKRGEVLVNRFGYALRGYAGAVVDGLRLDGAKGMHGKTWRVSKA